MRSLVVISFLFGIAACMRANSPSSQVPLPIFYSPSSPSSTSSSGGVEPAPPALIQAVPYRVVFFGDYKNEAHPTRGNALAEVATLLKSLRPDYIITAGDNNYENGLQSTVAHNIGTFFWSYITAGRFFLALGNHDRDVNNDYRATMQYVGMPAENYSFSIGAVGYVVFNSDCPYNSTCLSRFTNLAGWIRAMQGWVAGQIRGLRSRPGVKKIVLVSHHPSHAEGDFGQVGNPKEQAWKLELDADLHITGHYHRMEANLLTNAQNQKKQQFMTGGGGHPNIYKNHYPCAPDSRRTVASELCADRTGAQLGSPGVLKADVEGDGSMTLEYIDVHGNRVCPTGARKCVWNI